jgi:hypothetical protein
VSELGNGESKWTELAQHPSGVGTLMQATDGHPMRSERYRDIFAPLGLGDELRAVLRVRGSCWGYVCLHRVREPSQRFLGTRRGSRIAPCLADGIRMGLLRQACELEHPAEGPGLVILGADGDVHLNWFQLA